MAPVIANAALYLKDSILLERGSFQKSIVHNILVIQVSSYKVFIDSAFVIYGKDLSKSFFNFIIDVIIKRWQTVLIFLIGL